MESFLGNVWALVCLWAGLCIFYAMISAVVMFKYSAWDMFLLPFKAIIMLCKGLGKLVPRTFT